MKISNLIQNENSQELILVFGGFASHPSHFAHLKSDKNVVLVYDYENLDFKFDLNSTHIAIKQKQYELKKLSRQDTSQL